MLLDADEFIHGESRDALQHALAALPAGSCGLLEWLYYVPVDTDDAAEPNPVRRIRHVRRMANPRCKVVIPRAVLCGRDFTLKPGNHRCTAHEPPEIEHRELAGVALAHFPVRSVAQLSGKVIIGEWALASRNNRRRAEGFHWRDLHDRVMRGDVLTADDLRTIAANYSCSEQATDYELEVMPLRPQPDFELKYSGAAGDFLRDALAFADVHFKRLATTALANGDTSVGKTVFGLMAYHEGDTVIGRSLKLYGEWAANEVYFLRRFIHAGDWVIDVGANIGTHTIPFSESVGPAGKVFAFEPQRIPYQLLCANAALNNRYNIHPQNIGLGREEARVNVPVVTSGNIGKVGVNQWGQGESVNIVPLDAWGFPKVRLIKIDVEGMECDVLEGATDTMGRLKPLLFVENNTRQHSAKLIGMLFDLGYDCWWFFDPYYNPANFYGNPENIFVTVGRPEINMICAHRDLGMALDGLARVRSADQDWREALREILQSQ